ncbi:MAG: IS1380 family transposase [Halanaerobiales bacterium]|nr:IS1380 family transposase [Halanaerobiales bacterium]
MLKTDRLASQPTVSRRNNELNKSTFKMMEYINTELFNRAYKIEHPESIIFDLDSTHINTYGKQHGSAYNFHYSSTGFHPLMVFDGMTGDLIKAELRSGNVYTSRNVTRFMDPVLVRYRKMHKKTSLVIRADSGFAMPKLYELAKKQSVAYAIRLKVNAILSKLSTELTEEFYDKYGSDFTKMHTHYGEFMYRAKSWDKERRVVCKIQRKTGELLPSYTFVVTSMKASAKDVIRFYSKRGTMENFIKEAKLDFGMDTLSHSSYIANANRLMQMVLAYNLNNLMRRLCFSEDEKPKRMHTLRTLLTKVAGRFICSGRYSTFKLCSSYPYKSFFVDLFERIELLPSFG